LTCPSRRRSRTLSVTAGFIDKASRRRPAKASR
jgi:hypothetical protein